jgi:Domain of unknown function DUF11/Right handed beta helix region
MRPLLALLLALAALPLDAASDLRVIPQKPARYSAGVEVMLLFSIANDGPDAPSAAIVSIAVPPGLTLTDTNLRGCGGSDPVRCQTGDLPLRQLTNVYLRFAAPPTDASYDVSVSVSATIPDPNPANNSATATFSVSTSPDLYLGLQANSPPVDPGATFPFAFYAWTVAKPVLPAANARIRIDVENATIENVVDERNEGWTCTWTGTTATCHAPQFVQASFILTLRATSDRSGLPIQVRGVIESDAEDFNAEDNENDETIRMYRWIAVTNTNDEGPGSFRDAIHEANGNCGPGPCRMVFEIAGPVPAEGWFTIRPQSPLPVLGTWRVIIDGATQTALSGDTNPHGPEIFLDGSESQGGDGISLESDCDTVVRGLAVGNFGAGVGIRVMPQRARVHCGIGGFRDRRVIERNHIGVDPTGMRAAPNLRGLHMGQSWFTLTHNVISGNHRVGVWDAQTANTYRENFIGVAADGTTPLPNGASGVFTGPGSSNIAVLHNVISYNGEMGVAIRHGSYGAVHGNSMRHNGGLGIDIGLDGVSPRGSGNAPNPPALHSARYDAGTDTTIITGEIDGIRPQFFVDYTIGIYANDTPDGDGEEFIASVEPAVRANTFTATVKGDLRGKWINAAQVIAHWIVWNDAEPRSEWFEPSNRLTSELCAAIPVE